MIKELKEMLKRDEGTGPVSNGRQMMYMDSENIWTVGYGRNIQEKGVSPDEADLMLGNDLADSIKDCYKFEWYPKLDEVRQAVVCNMMFNLGFNRFSGFKKTIQLISQGSYVEASIEMLDSKWASQVGPRATRLSNMMSTGEWDV